MNSSPGIRPEEVRHACEELGLADWAQGGAARVTVDDARAIRDAIGAEAIEVSLDAFRRGLEVELEHGLEHDDTNVTSGHPVLTGKIVLAHLRESLLYYERLDVAEFEGDLLKAIQAGDPQKTARVHRKLLEARRKLVERELETCGDD